MDNYSVQPQTVDVQKNSSGTPRTPLNLSPYSEKESDYDSGYFSHHLLQSCSTPGNSSRQYTPDTSPSSPSKSFLSGISPFSPRCNSFEILPGITPDRLPSRHEQTTSSEDVYCESSNLIVAEWKESVCMSQEANLIKKEFEESFEKLQNSSQPFTPPNNGISQCGLIGAPSREKGEFYIGKELLETLGRDDDANFNWKAGNFEVWKNESEERRIMNGLNRLSQAVQVNKNQCQYLHPRFQYLQPQTPLVRFTFRSPQSYLLEQRHMNRINSRSHPYCLSNNTHPSWIRNSHNGELNPSILRRRF